ncbi:hypothetical protein B9Q06_09530 [Candidatus Marsarchaeota G2 archaeon ECH_B_2]|uniref:Uncharacterized protein n=3 Tax=Candidatus Marsarchaeota group 2 TaxID=2203771 RepID=A0A2R6B427_9ARCH|nr:MAG: hypothetical protein B9Q06_12100 [Candidatus Marsarchaeota G2 archaeon ECH_B_2]PSN94374.1 MAG: hypothetical protein B9Q06_09530 [Candidatus Marsarchaeota G2 archaeon ECH_B_2]PSN97788.1 MAG: hypothetical protein B9Q07_11385 [Candidatus Marsarchaeota G2 archaeon ECH_B_3]PSO01501.1 MAG: hypothetical protein B9Q05_08645 [Candidatus Marsarchaeota G2 archaeon ECH_B_1]
MEWLAAASTIIPRSNVTWLMGLSGASAAVEILILSYQHIAALLIVIVVPTILWVAFIAAAKRQPRHG